ncbi:MAG: radical SAM protein [Candidatus Thermoplasmatota archaeon]|nr:radical SAM protein [Candidatus Thermoplasmatota archaeon]
MSKIRTWLNESIYLAPLSPACKMCAQGAKLVVLITGQCPASCFYCPLSFEKGGTDRIFADEWELDHENDTEKLIQEATYIDAKGAGITGGDPLIVWQRTCKYISLLKDAFGSSFHIHLYTSGLQNAEHIDDLVDAGLDEIRFHPTPSHWSNMQNSSLCSVIEHTASLAVDTALEIPILPEKKQEILALIQWGNQQELQWINMNELEFSERNAEALTAKHCTVKDDISAAVKGSQECAYDILERVANKDLDIGVHYCSSSFKDGVQLTNRIKRRARHVAQPHEIISDDGTLLRGVVYSSHESLLHLRARIQQEFQIADEHIVVNSKKQRIELALWILETIATHLKEKGYDCFLVEEYPTADGLEVERVPLPL